MKAAPFQSVMNAGEFGPRMDARVDFEKYAAAVSRGLNMIALPQGGLTLRPGTRFIKATKTGAARVFGFEPVAESSYIVEAGEQYLRFYRNQGSISVAETDAAITNGTFTSDITGWTDVSTGTGAISWSSGTMAFSSVEDGYSAARQAITIGASYQAEVHAIRFRVLGDIRAEGTVRVGTTAGDDDLALATIGWGYQTISFTPGQGTVYLEFRTKSGRSMKLDDVEFLSDEVVEIPTPYAVGEVNDIRIAQSADVVYMFHPDHPVYRLERRGDASWAHVRTFFEDGPWGGINPGIDLGEANLIPNFRFESGTEGWTKAVTGTGFVDHDEAQGVVFLRRRAPVDPTSAADYAGTALIRHETSTPNTGAVHVLHFQIVGSGEIELSVGSTAGGTEIVTATDYGAGWYSVSFTPGVSTFYVQFKGDQDLEVIGGVGAVFCYQSRSRMLTPSGKTGSVTLTVQDGADAVFASTDVGRLVRLEWPGREPGYGYITGFTSATQVTLQVARKLPETAPTETWQLGSWSDTTGYPRTGALFQQRLYAGRTYGNPQTIWASQTGNFEDMRPDSWVAGASTVEDDDAINVTLAAKRISPIHWIAGTRRLLVGTASGNWAFRSQGAALTPLDISAEAHTSVDCADMEPVQIDEVGIFTHRAKRSVYDIGFSYEIEGFRASDLTILAEHVNRPGIEEMAYQAEPFSNVWTRLADGTMACMTYKRAQGVVGWLPQELAGDGEVISMATIPGATAASGQVYDSSDRDELWLVVKRTINGNEVHYIEMMEGVFDGPNRAAYLDKDTFATDMRTDQASAFYVDCGLTYSGTPVSSVSGLDHLEGETVKVVADGAVQQDKTVASGAITLDQAASTVHVGLGYSWVIRSLKLPYGAQGGSGVAKTKTINKIGVVLKDSASFEYGVEVEGDVQLWRNPFRNAAMPMGEAVPLFTGEVILDLDGGYDTDPRVLLKGDLPLPVTLLGFSPEMKTNERL